MIEITEARIKQAIKDKELVAYYQPQVDTFTETIRSIETLCRWITKDGETVRPDSFIPLAEESQLVCEIDWYMLEEACKTLTKLIEMDKAVPIAFNFSRNHLKEEDYIQKLCSIVDSYNIDHSLIIVEITETSLLEKNKSVVKGVNKIKEKGFKIAVDDFGSGLSSLSFVKNVNADIIKFDKSVMCDESTDEKSRLILTYMIDLFNRLNFTTVAEGVENQSQLGVLKTADCRLIQGYIFYKPMSQEDLLQAILSQKKNSQDIIQTKGSLSPINLLLDAVFIKHPMVMLSNLTRDSYVILKYENFHTHYSPASGKFSELIKRDAHTMHPDDQENFKYIFSIPNLMEEYKKGSESVSCITRQKGDDGTYMKVKSTDYFVKSPSTDDILIITLCENLE